MLALISSVVHAGYGVALALGSGGWVRETTYEIDDSGSLSTTRNDDATIAFIGGLVLLVIALIFVLASIRYLRGKRGARTFFIVMWSLSLLFPALLVATLFIPGVASSAPGALSWWHWLGVLATIGIGWVLPGYLLFNRSTASYFSHQSVYVRTRVRAGLPV
ncbi:hypothetical protein ACWDPV_06815 [Gordonia sp. NPDC003504]